MTHSTSTKGVSDYSPVDLNMCYIINTVYHHSGGDKLHNPGCQLGVLTLTSSRVSCVALEVPDGLAVLDEVLVVGEPEQDITCI